MQRIAVIDDDPNMRDLLRIHLSAVGFVVEGFEDASSGIRGLLKRPPNVLILDLMLPDLGGLEVLQAIRGDVSTKHLKVLVLTSRKDDETYAKAKELGADGYLTKPIRREELIESVLNLLYK